MSRVIHSASLGFQALRAAPILFFAWAALSASGTLAAPTAQPGSVVISQVYGGGGNSGAVYTNDFIELYNRSGASVSLDGWTVQYASAAGAAWQTTPLSGTLQPGQHYLVRQAAGAGGTQELPTPDASGTLNLSATAGKVALVETLNPLSGSCPAGGAVIDLVGYGSSASCYEGSGPAPSPSNTAAVLRAAAGSTDTDENWLDFTLGAPNPRSTADRPPAVLATRPVSGTLGAALEATLVVTFSEPVNVTGAWFALSCASSGAHAAAVSGGPVVFALDPLTDFVALEVCTVNIAAAQVTDQDADDPPDTLAVDHSFSFTTLEPLVCGDPATPIHAVQGSGAASPLDGASGLELEGMVVGDYQEPATEFGGFFIQEEDGQQDAYPATSEALFVLANSLGTDVQPGERVRVKGTVDEVSGLTTMTAVTSVISCAAGHSVTPATLSLPVNAASDLEAFEGMLVTVPQTLTVTDTFNLGRFGEVSLSANGRLYAPTSQAAPGPPSLALQALNDRSRLLLDDADDQQNRDPTRYPPGGLNAANSLRLGDTITGLTGVLDYRFGAFRVQPAAVPITFLPGNPRPLTPPAVGGTVRVAAINVLNYFNGDGLGGGFPTERGASTLVEFTRQRAKVINAIAGLDAHILGLMEIENDAPGNSAIEDLVAGLNAATAPGAYAYIGTGVIGTDAIRVALLYRPALITPVGPYALLTTAVDSRFLDTKNRPSLAQTFSAGGARFTVVVNHFKSKGSDCNDVVDPDTGDGQGNCNLTRANAALAVVDWLASDPTGSGDPDFLVIGDLNAYAREDPLTVFADAGYVNLVEEFAGAGAYSYVFDGQAGALDHALASPSLAAQANGAAEWHLNADEPSVLDYNVEFKSANQIAALYAPEAYRASDHDPLLIGLSLSPALPARLYLPLLMRLPSGR